MLPDTWMAILCLGIVIVIIILLKFSASGQGVIPDARSGTTKEPKGETPSNMQKDAGLLATWRTAFYGLCPATPVLVLAIDMI